MHFFHFVKNKFSYIHKYSKVCRGLRNVKRRGEPSGKLRRHPEMEIVKFPVGKSNSGFALCVSEYSR